ncbi:MAG: hypothetical protein WCO54_07590 [Bacteroidota bacterium]
MKTTIRILLFAAVFFYKSAFAQTDSTLAIYFVHSKLDDECSADVVMTLFNKNINYDRFNDVVLDHLLKGFYDPQKSSVNLENLYQNKTLEPTAELIFTIGGSCQFHKNGVYSFIACTYNVCEKNQRSNFEPNMITIDINNQKILKLEDFIDPLKRDSFENYVYYTINRYHIKNVPTCYFASTNPMFVKSSNNVTTKGDTIILQKGLTNRFYLSDDKFYVYNKASHRDYTFNSIEVMFQLYYMKYFMRPEMLKRLGF